MEIPRIASGGWKVGIPQHVAGIWIVEVLDAVCEPVFFQARDDRFAHFLCRPKMIVAARDEHDGTVNLFGWNCCCRHGF
jgi:hypothetical protein